MHGRGDRSTQWHACDNLRMQSPDPVPPPRMRQRLRPLLSHESWKQRAVLWGGAVAVALVAIVFAKASDAAFHLFQRIIVHSPWWALLLTPSVFALLAWLTNGVLRPTRGSGIPQVIAALERPDDAFRQTNLSLRVSAGKLLLTTLALLGGASVGREGPTVHVGASLMYVLGRWFGFRDPRQASHFLLAGGAAGEQEMRGLARIAETEPAPEHVHQAGADVHGGAFAPDRGAAEQGQRGQQQFAGGHAQRQVGLPERVVGPFQRGDDLRNAAAAGGAQHAVGQPGQQREHARREQQRPPRRVHDDALEQMEGGVAGLGEHDRDQRHRDRAAPQHRALFPALVREQRA